MLNNMFNASIVAASNVGSNPDTTNYFITKFSVGSAENLVLPLSDSETYNFTVDWGDGNSETINSSTAEHIYATGGIYTVKINGTMPVWNFSSKATSALKITSIDSWGEIAWTSMSLAFSGCENITSIASGGVFSGVTDFNNCWSGCTSLTSFPTLDYSSGTNFTSCWSGCTSLTNFPNINFASGTSFSHAWEGCSSMINFNANFPSGLNFGYAWHNCTSLSSFNTTNLSAGETFDHAWEGCTSLSDFATTSLENGQTFSYAWAGSGVETFASIAFTNGTDFSYTWENCTSLTDFALCTFGGTNIDFTATWKDCTSIVDFPHVDLSGGTIFNRTWQGCSSIDSFDASIDVSNGISFNQTWQGCSTLTSFPSKTFAYGEQFNNTWYGCSGLTTFPDCDFSSGINFQSTWQGCTAMETFNSQTFGSSISSLSSAWNNCPLLGTIASADVGGATLANAFFDCGSLYVVNLTNISEDVSFEDCNLDATQIDNIFANLDTVSDKTINVLGNPGTASMTRSTATGKGWTVIPPQLAFTSDLNPYLYEAGPYYTLEAVGAGTLAYSITGGDDASLFGIDASTGDITFITPPNFEIPNDSNGDNIYELVVQASDDLGDVSDALTITILDSNEALEGFWNSGTDSSTNGVIKATTVDDTGISGFNTVKLLEVNNIDASSISHSLTGTERRVLRIKNVTQNWTQSLLITSASDYMGVKTYFQLKDVQGLTTGDTAFSDNDILVFSILDNTTLTIEYNAASGYWKYDTSVTLAHNIASYDLKSSINAIDLIDCDYVLTVQDGYYYHHSVIWLNKRNNAPTPYDYNLGCNIPYTATVNVTQEGSAGVKHTFEVEDLSLTPGSMTYYTKNSGGSNESASFVSFDEYGVIYSETMNGSYVLEAGGVGSSFARYTAIDVGPRTMPELGSGTAFDISPVNTGIDGHTETYEIKIKNPAIGTNFSGSSTLTDGVGAATIYASNNAATTQTSIRSNFSEQSSTVVSGTGSDASPFVCDTNDNNNATNLYFSTQGITFDRNINFNFIWYNYL